ncbi:SCO family protein [Pseudalkalibacillus caeni]|uniref:SCO family protein n=1 Tax=Exobacillus caeni TaxID=2574798 RepID=A0A5R9F5N6_9BACL|nr:SCO family protein [Pseudalkalibacillus caeni]
MFISMLLVGALVLSACGKDVPNDLDWKVQDFAYTDQNGKELGLSDLKGKVWIADFIFTNCDTVCPPMTANMAEIQQKLEEKGLDYEIVSFSVDPERDTPEALTEFAGKFDADLSSWHFLTGYKLDEIEEFAKNSFKAAVSADPNSDQFLHGTSFYLVNKEGTVVKKYSGVSNVPTEEIVEDVAALQ